jgi:outer membrane lipoprotein-sorting protein
LYLFRCNKIKWSKLRMKKFNLAALPLAVAGVLASTSAFAGTEACFEIYTAGDNAVADAFDTKYDLASCVRGGATATTLADIDSMAIAYELTGDNLGVEFTDIDGAHSVAEEDLVVVYVPTTDIPGGTKITMKLSGSKAKFNGNGNQIHLVKDSGDATNFEAVGSSDGTLDGSDTAVFITKAGVTIGAGTRLVLSRNSTGLLASEFAPIGVVLDNDDCTTATSASSVKIEATEAITDGGTGYSIQGAVSEATTLIDVSPQFWALQDGDTAEVEVNAESSDSGNNAIVARTEFVYDQDAGKQLVAKKFEAIYKTAFYNTEPNLDQYIELDADDHLETAFVNGMDAGAGVEMGLWNARVAATGVLATQEEVEDAVTWGALSADAAAPTIYDTEALDVFTPEATGGDAETNPHTTAADETIKDGALYNVAYYVVTNDEATAAVDPDTNSVMNFNYSVDTKYTLDFGTDGELDHCEQEKETHKVGVNGAVLKVPYVVSAEGNFVRITNEHDESAEVTFDMFGESLDGTEANRKVTAVSLGTVPAQSSVVYFVPQLLEDAQAAGYLGADGGYGTGDLGSNHKSADNRHTVTFTVTAPRDSVHGVSVQKIIGGLDRVMPVLDQNAWSQ